MLRTLTVDKNETISVWL